MYIEFQKGKIRMTRKKWCDNSVYSKIGEHNGPQRKHDRVRSTNAASFC
jgi:hypothetical protein